MSAKVTGSLGTVRSCLSIFAAVLLAACSSLPVASGTEPVSCSSNADCPKNEVCTYAVQGSCGSVAYCNVATTGACVTEVACGCNGGNTQVCLISGESPVPIAHLGTCDGGLAYPPPTQ